MFNRFKGNSAPYLMGWVPKLLRLMEKLKGTDPVVGYNPLVAEDMRAWDAATDNSYLSLSRVPNQPQARENMDITPDSFALLRDEMVTGVWNGDRSLLQEPGPQGLWKTRPDQNLSKAAEVASRWDPPTIKTIAGCVLQMEKSDRFNPLGLEIPRNKDGSPCFWRTDLVPPDMDWAFLNRQYQGRLITMTEECDPVDDTPEPAATMLLLHCFWWLRTGGKCHIFGFIMTLYVRYDSKYSFGHAMYYLDAEGKETTKPIVAGSPMVSGFLQKFLTNVLDTKQFDVTQLTIVVESWPANVLRWNYPVSTYPEIIARYLAIKASTEWYEAPKRWEEYYHVDLPKPPPHRTVVKADVDEVAGCQERTGDEEVNLLLDMMEDRVNPDEVDRVQEGKLDDDDEDAELDQERNPDTGASGAGGGNGPAYEGKGKQRAKLDVEMGGASRSTLMTAATGPLLLLNRPQGPPDDAVDDDHVMYPVTINVGKYPTVAWPTRLPTA